MTISSQNRKAGPYAGSDSQISYPFDFKVFKALDLLVVCQNISTGVEDVMTLVTDYTVTLNANQNSNPGGTVHPVTPVGIRCRLTISSDLPYLQPDVLTNQGGFYPLVISNALDRLTIFIQQLWDNINRSMKFPISDAASNYTLPGQEQRKGKFLFFDPKTGAPTVTDTLVNTFSVVPSSKQTVYRFVASAGQVIFTGTDTNANILAYTPGKVEVYVNGLRQDQTQFTAVNGTSAVLVNPSAAADKVVVVAFGTFYLSDIGAVDVDYRAQTLGGVMRTVASRLNDDALSVKDHGAIGTNNPANIVIDTLAIASALATGRNVRLPEGIYYTSETVNVGYGQRLFGAGRGKTVLVYTGVGDCVYLGGPGNTTLIYDCECSDMTIVATGRAATMNGVRLDNAVYFLLSDLGIYGSGSPNSTNSADRILYGSGVLATNNSIIGEVRRVSCRVWEKGRYYKCLSTNSSAWSAAIVDGQGELATNTWGMWIGDPTVPFESSAGITISDLSFQGNYSAGIVLNSGSSIRIHNNYFEGNGSHDVVVGNISSAPPPICASVAYNLMASEGIGPNPYGLPTDYITKIRVINGSFTSIHNNNCSISTAIPLISVDAAAIETRITENRLNSLAPVNARILDNSTSTITRDNSPEAPRVGIGSFVRGLASASGNVSVTGLGFRPTNIEFICAVNASNERSVGHAGLTISGYANRCLTTDFSGANFSSTDCLRIIRSSPGNEQKAVLATMDKDGFTLAWTKVGSPPGVNEMVVNYWAFR